MKSINKVLLVGYLGEDPEIRELSNGDLLATLRMATTTTYRNGGEESKKATQWHTVKVWGKEEVEGICTALAKGSHILVEGQINYGSYEDKNGQKKFTAEIKAWSLIDLDR